jgi:hypothetical protein
VVDLYAYKSLVRLFRGMTPHDYKHLVFYDTSRLHSCVAEVCIMIVCENISYLYSMIDGYHIGLKCLVDLCVCFTLIWSNAMCFEVKIYIHMMVP